MSITCSLLVLYATASTLKTIMIPGKRSTLYSPLRCSIFLGTCPSHSPRTNTPATPPTPGDLKHVEKRTHFRQARIFQSAVQAGSTCFFLGAEPPATHLFICRREADGFPPSASKCAPPFVPVSPRPFSFTRRCKTCTCNLSGLADLAAAAGRGHVHAPYTSPGSGVAAGLKGRYTHRELRWGRPTWARPAWAWVTPPRSRLILLGG